MKIISSYPILNNNQVINKENSFSNMDSGLDVDYANYCNADADYSNVKGKKKAKAPKTPKAPKQTGALGNKILGAVYNAKQSGLTDSLKTLGRNFIDKKTGKQVADNTVIDNSTPDNSPTPDVKEGLTKNQKIGIAVGSVVVFGIIGYLIFRKK